MPLVTSPSADETATRSVNVPPTSMPTDALMGAPSFGEKGLRIGPEVCVLINGMPRPAVTLEAFQPEDIEAVEVYAWTSDPIQLPGSAVAPSGKDGDRSGTLNAQWPRTAACGQNYRSSTRGGTKVGSAKYMVVWLRSK